MKAEWIVDYDMHEHKTYQCPGCRECYAPVFKMEDGKYYCVFCGEEAEIDEDMIEYFEEREGTKTEMKDCFPEPIGCGGKACVEVQYRKNPVTLKWQTMGGKCNKCGMKFIV